MSHIQIRISGEEKKAAQQIIESMGLTLSSSIKLFLRQVVKEKKIPFQLSAEAFMADLANNNKTLETEEVQNDTDDPNSWNFFTKQKIG